MTGDDDERSRKERADGLRRRIEDLTFWEAPQWPAVSRELTDEAARRGKEEEDRKKRPPPISRRYPPDAQVTRSPRQPGSEGGGKLQSERGRGFQI